MDRFFATLPFGKIIWRSSRSISTDGELFKPGDHIDTSEANEGWPQMPRKVKMTPETYVPTQEELDGWKEQAKKIDPAMCCLRMERQTLHRLQKTGAIIFAFKTFLEPLSELKKEGCGKQLAYALDVQAMDVYKDGVIWREPLVEYLTS
jgi:hypothetical protein